MKDNIKRLIRSDILAIKAYDVPDSAGMIKLDAMENPYAFPEQLQQEWLEALSSTALNRYPDAASTELLECLHQVMNIPARYQVLLGNGSDELIQLLALALAHEKNNKPLLLTPEPTFSMYKIIANIAGINFHGVPLSPDFQFDSQQFISEVKQHNPSLIFFAQPNNPTGHLYSEKDLRQVIEASQGLVVIDEAYTAFTDFDSMHLLDDYDNVLILRTLSKLGLAGLRFGLLIGQPAWLAELNKIRLPYNVNTLTQASVTFALKNYSILLEQATQICTQRDILFKALNRLSGIKVWPSQANFILLKVLNGQAKKLYNELRQAGILIKCLDQSHPLLENCLRVTIGTEVENKQFLQQFTALVE